MSVRSYDPLLREVEVSRERELRLQALEAQYRAAGDHARAAECMRAAYIHHANAERAQERYDRLHAGLGCGS